MRPYLILITMLLSACSPRLIAAPPLTPASLPEEEAPLVSTASYTPKPSEKITSLAIADLSRHLSVEPSLIQVVSTEPALWPDTSLGCPQPGQAYTQQTVQGYQIHLEAKGQEYIYHTDSDQTVVLCIEENLPSFPVTPGEIDDGKPWMPAN